MIHREQAEKILPHVDHTLLSQTATWEDIKQICDDGMKYGCASVCIPPSFVKQAKEYMLEHDNGISVCTVIGFPNGYSTTATKVFETRDAIENGADEIDMVINVGDVKDKRFDKVEEEIKQVRSACDGHILKVIIETCFLTEEEKIAMCKTVTNAGADYIKTSTGFGGGGATAADVVLMKENVGDKVKVKASGGISSFPDGEMYLILGADRLGTSKLVRIVENEGFFKTR